MRGSRREQGAGHEQDARWRKTHKDKKGKEEKKRSASSVKLEQTRGEKTDLDEESQEVRLDDAMYASMREQVSLITEYVGKSQATREEMQHVVEQVKSMRMVMADARKHATEKMEEGLKKLEEVRAKGTKEEGVMMRVGEEVGRMATREGKGKGNGGKGEHAYREGEFRGKGAARMMEGDDEGGEVDEERKEARRPRWADWDDKEDEEVRQGASDGK